MSGQELLMLWSDSQGLNIFIWILIVLGLLYLARYPAHALFGAFARIMYHGFRSAARSVQLAERRVVDRNREVMLSMAEENQERVIEREFHRVNAVVSRDLSSYPALHRTLSDTIVRIDEDYRESTESPPTPPPWVDAVDAVARIPSNGDPTVGKVLENIHGTMKKASKDAVNEYRKASRRRHQFLKRMLPYWRMIATKLKEVHTTITGLEERSQVIDTQMDRYEDIRNKKDRVLSTLSSSAGTQFAISLLVLIIATLGGVINFHLIARPMAEIAGGTQYVGPFQIADVAAMVIIMVEIAMGLFLMESLRITRLFPVIGALDDRMRKNMLWITLTILTILAGVEAALAYMRDYLALQDENLQRQLAEAGTGGEPAFRWIPTIGQMVLGFILPFALAFIAIPLESFIHSGRTVIGALIATILRIVAYLLRLFGTLFRNLGKVMIGLYDLVIFLPLSIEHGIRRAMDRPGKGEAHQ